jgi:hypothetical protein
MAVAERITASNELAWKKDVALVLMGVPAFSRLAGTIVGDTTSPSLPLSCSLQFDAPTNTSLQRTDSMSRHGPGGGIRLIEKLPRVEALVADLEGVVHVTPGLRSRVSEKQPATTPDSPQGESGLE